MPDSPVAVTTRERCVAWAALVVACTPQILYVSLLGYRQRGERAIALFAVATIGWAQLVCVLRRSPGALRLRSAIAVILVMGAVMVSYPARGSNDVYSYSMYGRILTEHHSNPYTALPDQFPHDPLFASVGPVWRHTPSRYGPIFTGLSAIGTSLLPGERIPLRVFFQIVSALAAGSLLLLVWRRWRSPAALVFVALHPLMLVSVVNGAHNDIFVALGVFAFAMLLERDRIVWAGVAIAAAALVKATALLAVVAACCWIVLQVGRPLLERLRAAALLGSVAVGAAGIGTVTVPGCAAAIGSAADLNGNASIWFPFSLYATHGNTFPVHGLGWSAQHVEQFVKTPALLVTLLALGVGVWMLRRSAANFDVAIAVGVVSFSVFAAWVMPWYIIWCLPLVAMHTGRLRMTIALHAMVVLAVAHLHKFAHEQLNVRTWFFLIVVPLAVVPVYGWAIWSDARRSGARRVD